MFVRDFITLVRISTTWATCFGALLLVASARAATIDLTTDTGGNGPAFDGQSSGFTSNIDGMDGDGKLGTIDVMLTMTVNVSSDDTVTTIEATGSGMGVDNGSINGSDEVFTFQFNLPVEIIALDFANVQAADEGTVNFSNNPTGNPFTVADSPGTQDDLEFGTPIVLPAGETVTLTGAVGESFSFERIQLNVIPEPASLVLLSIGLLGIGAMRLK